MIVSINVQTFSIRIFTHTHTQFVLKCMNSIHIKTRHLQNKIKIIF